METLWSKGPCSIRQLLEAFPPGKQPAYTTVQTVVYRLEAKKAVRRSSRISNANVFEAVVSRSSAQRRLIDDLVALFGGQRLPIVTHLIESGGLTPGRGTRSAEGAAEPDEEREASMTPADLYALANHLWQSTLFAAIAGS